MAKTLQLVPPVEPIAVRKLDIACGQRSGEREGKRDPGWKGIDLEPEADIVHDLFEFPWPIKAASVKEARCYHFVEHIPHEAPRRIDEAWEYDGFFMFFAEVHRILAMGGTIEILTPYSRSDRAFWDPTHTRYIHEGVYMYLNREWREMNKIDHYMPDINFETVTIEGLFLPDDIVQRADEYQMHARNYWFNVVNDLRVTLKKAR